MKAFPRLTHWAHAAGQQSRLAKWVALLTILYILALVGAGWLFGT
jgi:uncharacterized membrane protein YqjE